MKLLIIGWDGATYRHLQQIAPTFYGSLPYGGKLLPEDLFLGSYIDSANAWTAITTGVPFEQHRVLVFRYPPIHTAGFRYKVLTSLARQRFLGGWCRRALINRVMGPICRERTTKDDSRREERWLGNFKGRLMPAISTDIKFARFWDYIPGPALIYGLPLTYPAFRMNGILVSGIPAPLYGEAKFPTIFPRELEAKIRSRFKGFYYTDGESPLASPQRPNLDIYLENIPRIHQTAIETFIMLAKQEEFSIGFLLLPLIDDYLHANDDWEQIRKMYLLLDSTTRELVEEVSPEHFLLLSDHGMKPYRRYGLGIRMDHDTKEGIWASDLDLGLRRHIDVTPAIVQTFDRSFKPLLREPQLEVVEPGYEDKDEIKNMEDRLRQLGYL